MPYIIYADLESLIKKLDECAHVQCARSEIFA